MPLIRSFISWVLKRRSLTFWIAFSLFLTVLLSGVVKWWWIQRMEGDWSFVLREKTEEIASGFQGAFGEYQRETHDLAVRIRSMDAVRQSFSGEPDQRGLFILLDRAGIPPEMSVELYNRDDKLLAWWGTSGGIQSAGIDVHRETSFVSSGSVYSYLTVVLPATFGQQFAGAVVVHRLFDVNYPFSNRFISSAAFTQTFPRRLQFPVGFQFIERTGDIRKQMAREIPFVGIRGDTVGFALVDEVKPALIIEPVRRVFRSISGIAAAALSIIVLVMVVRRIHSSSRSLLRILGVAGCIWFVRYFWLWIDFPSGLFSGGIFDPGFFASPFGSGISKSIGELFVTSMAGLGTMVYVAQLSLPKILEPQAGSQRGNLQNFAGIVLPILAAVLFVLHRGFIAAVRSAVFDSTLRYSDPASILPSLEAGVMLVNLYLIAIAFTLAAVLLILAGYRVVVPWLKGRVIVPVAVGTVFILIGVLFGIFHPNPLADHVVRALVVIGASAAAVVLYRRAGVRRLPHVVLVGAVALVIAVFHLDDQVHRRDEKNIELLGVELTRPSDAWMRLVLEQALRDMQRQPGLDILASQDQDRLQRLAFTLWSRSMLSRVGYNCAIYVYDRGGHLVSNFRIGIRDFEPSLVPPSPPVRSPGGTQVRTVEHAEPLGKRKTYVGSTAALSSEGVPVGTLEVGISAAEHFFLTSDMPPILQTYEREETERSLRSLIVSEFVDGNLVYSTGEGIPDDVQLPEATTSRVLAAGSLWIDETIGESEYKTYLLRVSTAPNDNVILGLSNKKADWRLHAFDFVRLLLFYLVVCAGVTVFTLALLLLRGRTVALSFRAKLFLAILLVSLIPLILIAYYNREITIERANNAIVDRLALETTLVRNRLLRELRYSSTQLNRRVNDEWCQFVAADIGTDFSVYIDAVKRASSKSELFQAEILDSRLSADAFFNIMVEGKNFFAEIRTIGNYDYLVGYRPLPLGTDHRQFAVLAVPLLYSQIEIAEDLARRNTLLFGAYAVVLLLIVVVGTIFANQISAPIRQLITGTQRIAKGELDYRIKVSRNDEIGELHQAFNAMTADLQQNRESLIKAEREMAWREMAKQVAHEIKNPLTPVKLSLQHLRQAFRDSDKGFPELLEQVTRTAIEQIETLSRIVSQFAHFARMPERREEDVDIGEVISEAARLFDENKDVDVRFIHPSTPMRVWADREELRRAFINVIRNAVQAMSEKGWIAIEATDHGGTYHVSITDSGPGIPEEVLPRLFEPNFSTKSEGMGLGLAIVKKTIDDLRGQISIRSSPGKGTTVDIVLPKSNQ